MASQAPKSATPERRIDVWSGWVMLFVQFVLIAGGITFVLLSAGNNAASGFALGGVLAFALGAFLTGGYFTLQPNEARVLILFGSYAGTVRDSGFHWANPFYARARGRSSDKAGSNRIKLPTRTTPSFLGYQSLSTKLSLRAQNFSSDTLKVNDKRGNPVEIGAVIVWRVENTAQAVFDEVSVALRDELHLRLIKAGVVVEEARLTHLAYAPEIAPVMLRRQQAEAVIAARQIIVQNAVVMVHMALRELEQQDVVRLDDERRAAMVSNLLVVLCGSSDPSPVINTGTLYA
jgi:hypothetical protein